MDLAPVAIPSVRCPRAVARAEGVAELSTKPERSAWQRAGLEALGLLLLVCVALVGWL